MLLNPFRRGERWSWYTLWLLPLMWICQFVLAPDLSYHLGLTFLTALGLTLPYGRFFSRHKVDAPLAR
jgi:hypothetical protein